MNLKARVAAAATTNATLVKGAPGRLKSINVANGAIAAKFLKLYDLAVAPTVGTSVPVATFLIPTLGRCDLNFGAGLLFTVGIAYAITGAIADSDTTAVAANDVHGVIGYQ
jgi:hypothetical protein